MLWTCNITTMITDILEKIGIFLVVTGFIVLSSIVTLIIANIEITAKMLAELRKGVAMACATMVIIVIVPTIISNMNIEIVDSIQAGIERFLAIALLIAIIAAVVLAIANIEITGNILARLRKFLAIAGLIVLIAIVVSSILDLYYFLETGEFRIPGLVVIFTLQQL